ncbi:MAG: tetratricopeptide repeat protein [Sphingomonas sp.]
MLRSILGGAVLAAMVTPAFAQQAQPTAPVAALPAVQAPVQGATPPTIQQSFEAATAMAAKNDYPGALAAWQALEKRLTKPRSLAIVRVNLGTALYNLRRFDEAVAAVRAGLVDLPVSDATLNDSLFNAWLQLGQIAESQLDYASATQAYRTAEPLAPDDTARLSTLRGLIATETFIDPDSATADLVRADALIASVKSDNKLKAIFATQRSVLLLNQGKFAEARLAAGAAVKLLGGLTELTDLYDVAARSDYAIAALLSGKPDDARHYMSATGAGRLPTGLFDPGVQMKSPECGGEAGLRPQDAAVVEFSIGDDGSVISSVPIYAEGGGAAALAFARTARQWSWSPDQVQHLPPFFQYRARVEMRCSTEFERPSVNDYLSAKFGVWLNAKGVAQLPAVTVSDAAALPGQRAQLAAAEATQGKDSIALLPLLYAMIQNPVVGREEVNAMARRALVIADSHSVTPIARVALTRPIWDSNHADFWKHDAYLTAARPALADPVFAVDPEARAAIRLILADELRVGDSSYARRLLKEVADDKGLAQNDPLKVGALIRIASLEAADGKFDAARSAFESSGLSARQCSIVDAPPQLVKTNATSNDFPTEARVWGFEGWTQIQFDISADGKVINPRAIMSYPPFVFTKAGDKVVGMAQFEKTYRPDGGLGCGGSKSRVRFTLGS